MKKLVVLSMLIFAVLCACQRHAATQNAADDKVAEDKVANDKAGDKKAAEKQPVSIDAEAKQTDRPATAGRATGATVTVSQQTDDAPADEKAEKKFEIPVEEKPFWDSAQAFVDAYAKRDAAAIGDMFTEDAEFRDEFGVRTVGRAAIVAMFTEVFAAAGDASIEAIDIDRIRRVTDVVALEEGNVVATDTADGPRYRSRYVALHVKGDDGRWRINTLKDFPREGGPRREQLAQLSWLLGEWVNQDDDSVVHTECRWSDDGNYLLRSFTVQSFDGRELNGVQRIGWDPAIEKLRSWTFDSGGGFFDGLWTRRDNQWYVATSGVNAEGKKVTGMAVYTAVDAEMITWRHENLIVGDEVRDNSPVVTMVRRPPEPKVEAAGGASK
ncbi:MAG: nuclear transport factor 2 family protein [Pirellulales bacterium]